MLVHVADNCVINMTGILQVNVRQKENIEYAGKSLFNKGTKLTTHTYSVEIVYKNADGVNAQFEYRCGNDDKFAFEIKKRVLEQVKEIENVGATQALEKALKDA